MRTLLIATEETLGPLTTQIGAARPPVDVAGTLLTGPSTRIHDEVTESCARTGAQRAIVCLPTGRVADRLAVRAILKKLGVIERVVTPIDEMLGREPGPVGAGGAVGAGVGGGVVDLGALIGREPQRIDRELVGETLAGRVVLITGAGGSIGSELVMTAAGFAPSRIVLMERSENSLFEIDRKLAAKFPGVPRSAVLHDVADAPRTRALCAKFRPGVVIHAAAHKHVPLMEDHPSHAVNNNVFGTIAIADAAAAVGAERFVLISTDKAVHPTSVMGATKRLAERYVQGLAARGNQSTRFSMVRFGNVLGSAGSVLQVWSNQIAEGGPVTLTDKRMTRYFMTIPEAASLVLQAGAMSGGGSSGGSGGGSGDTDRSGEVFVLDMGQPIRISQLVERFIEAHGFAPDWAGENASASGSPTMPIAVTGIRPGEKLHEQLAYDAEELSKTAHPGIRRFVDPAEPAADELGRMIDDLNRVRGGCPQREVLTVIARWIPGFADRARARLGEPIPANEPKPFEATEATEAA
ncbi:MAG: FlaA1/EpsC-like NDP-sugar epimerase [Phycisphaerales bacterium]|jgi:FlaA1/EpsC-like NDP-sugar epimerase